jgi:MtN3 and saliva related transmembrane protein
MSARRRLYKHLEPFPSKDAFKRGLDYLMYGVGLIQWTALLPQIVSVYVYHQTSGISIPTWTLLAFFNALWAIYGLVHKEKPILISNLLMGTLDLLVVVGVLWH